MLHNGIFSQVLGFLLGLFYFYFYVPYNGLGLFYFSLYLILG